MPKESKYKNGRSIFAEDYWILVVMREGLTANFLSM